MVGHILEHDECLFSSQDIVDFPVPEVNTGKQFLHYSRYFEKPLFAIWGDDHVAQHTQASFANSLMTIIDLDTSETMAKSLNDFSVVGKHKGYAILPVGGKRNVLQAEAAICCNVMLRGISHREEGGRNGSEEGAVLSHESFYFVVPAEPEHG